MQPSLSLQQALYRHQQRQIDALVASASPAFKAYERRYRREASLLRRRLTLDEVHERAARADVVYVGDYHTLKYAQRSFLKLVRAVSQTGRRVVLAVEFVESRHQPSLEKFLAGRIRPATFLARIGHPYSGAFDIWPNFQPIFETAQKLGLDVVAIDRRARGPRSLQVRDDAAARLIAKAAKAPDRPLVLVLMGQYHVASSHLPRAVKRSLGTVKREHLIVFQNPEGAWWKLAQAGEAERTEAIELKPGVVGVFNASPLVCQRTFLDYCEAEAGDAPIEDGGIAATVKTLARSIGRLAGVKLGDELERLEVLTPNDLDVIERLARRGNFSARELGLLESHVRSGQSAFVPRARAIWLSSFSLNHAAEEAAHFVRFCAVGPAMERERNRLDAFWARCVEEAIGYFGSKLVNPMRTCRSLEIWAHQFQQGDRPTQQLAAFVLALASLPSAASAEARRVVPADLERFQGASHALGYLLGEALFQAHRRGSISPARVRALFKDPLDDGASSYDALKRLAG